MAWVRLDGAFFRHPKIVMAGRDARDLYLAALCYAGSLLTDGFIPTACLRQLGADAMIDNHDLAATQLCAVGLWHSVDHGYQIHDYLDYQSSRAHAQEVSERRAIAGQRGGQVRASKRLANCQDDTSAVLETSASKTQAHTHTHTPELNHQGRSRESVYNAPAREEPPPPADEPVTRPAPKPEQAPVGFAEFWSAYPRKEARQTAMAAYRRLKPDLDTRQAIMDGLERWQHSRQWADDQIYPHATTWLNQRRWEDEPEPSRPPARASPSANNGRATKHDIITAGLELHYALTDGAPNGYRSTADDLAKPGADVGAGGRIDRVVRSGAGPPG